MAVLMEDRMDNRREGAEDIGFGILARGLVGVVK
jgi:hypothetical protein